MKKVISATIVLVFAFCMISTNVFAAVSQGENVDVGFAAENSITIDGTMSPGEWDGAAHFIVNRDTTGFTDPTDLSAEYYLKWDDTYLYLCEVRTDTDPLKYIVTKEHLLSGQFYQGDATLFFMCFDNGTTPNIPNPDERDIQYSASSPDNTPLYGVRIAEGNDRAEYTNGSIAAKVDANKSVTELKFKWSDLPNAAGNIKDGAKVSFYVCITKTKNDVKDIVIWNDWEAQAYQLIWGKGLNTDISDWNSMTLKAPAAAVPAATVPTTDSNPKTGDTSVFGYVFLALAAFLGLIMLVFMKNGKAAKNQ